MVNPGAFSGSRKQFLEAQKDVYAAAVSAGHTADTVADIQRRYFKRYPISLPHNVEPTEEWLSQVDDDGPDSEIHPPKEDGLSSEEYSAALAEFNTMSANIKSRKEQIKRRLQYQHTKERNDKSTADGPADPVTVLMAKLTGTTIKKPRMKVPFNLWAQEHRFFIDPIFNQRVIDSSVPAKQHAALRSAIYKESFDELPEEEQQEWVDRAEREHQRALEEHLVLLVSCISTGKNTTR